MTVAERPELLRAAYPLAAACYTELPTPAALDIGEDRWMAEEATNAIVALLTRTQRENGNMQRLNLELGYRTESETLNLRSSVAAVLSGAQS